MLKQISSILDRNAQLFGLYEAAEDIDVRLRLSAELRLLEQAAARASEAGRYGSAGG